MTSLQDFDNQGLSTANQCFLVGKLYGKINKNKLPTNLQVFRYFLYNYKVKGLPLNDSFQRTITRVLSFWSQTSIPVCDKKNCIPRLQNLFTQWKLLQKSKSRTTETEVKKRDQFQNTLQELFDISRKDSLKMITDSATKDFLLDQQGPRIQNLGFWSIKNRNSAQETDGENNANFSESDIEIDNDVSNDFELEVGSSKPKRLKVITPSVAFSLDRHQVSDSAAMGLVSATAVALGHDLTDISISCSTIRRARQYARKKFALEVKSNFNVNTPLTVHFDGKMLPDLIEKIVIDRIAILVTGNDVEQLLSVPKLSQGTGKLIAESIHETLQDWDIQNQVKAMCFDTTSVNTGRLNGACVLLEQLLGRRLLSFACRHHVFEIVLEKVFSRTVEASVSSSGPNIKIFKKFQKDWPNIDKTHFRKASDDPKTCKKLPISTRKRVLKFCREQISNNHPREDYLELLNLTFLFLGGTFENKLTFRAPAGLHRARWMSRLLYGFKIFMFGGPKEQAGRFKISVAEEDGIRELLCFAIYSGYIESWIMAPDSVGAPLHDLKFLKTLKAYEKVNKEVAQSAQEKFLNHLWYLSEELVALSFFDPQVSVQEKARMVKALNKAAFSPPSKQAKLTFANYKTSLGPSHFVTKNTKNFFATLDISTDFFQKHPNQWLSDETFIAAEKVVKGLKVVNDSAERGVALVQQFSGKLTKEDEQLQFLTQVVASHRKKFPNFKKSTLINGL